MNTVKQNKIEYKYRPRLFLTEANETKLEQLLSFHQISLQDVVNALVGEMLNKVNIEKKLIEKIENTNLYQVLPDLENKLKKN